MKTINRYMIYLYIPIIIALIVAFIAFLLRLRETSKKAALLADSTETLNAELTKAQDKIAAIEGTTESWTFFAAVYALLTIGKELRKDRKRGEPLSRSLTRSMTRHAGQIRNIRL